MRIPVLILAVLLSSDALAHSFGSPICEINVLPLVPMSPTLSEPPVSGWYLEPERLSYVPGVALRVRVRHLEATRRLRGIQLWAKSGPTVGAGSFALPSALFVRPPTFANCGQWSITHGSNSPKTQEQLQFQWTPPTAGAAVMRAFLIEDCASPGGCRAHQGLTQFVLIQEALFVDGFE